MGRVQALGPDQQAVEAKPATGPGIAPNGGGGIDFEDFFENGAIALHVVGRDGTILHANRAELELLGYSAEDYIGRNIVEFHADGEVIEDILARLTRGETLNKYPARLLARDGSVRHVHVTSNGQFSDGEFVSTRCFTVDVTEVVQAREDVRRKDEQLRGILDALPAAVYTTDAEGTITYANRACAELAGKEPEIGKDKWCVSFRLLTPQHQEMPHDACPMAVALKEDRPVRGVEALARRPDGTVVPILPFPTPLHDSDGRMIGAVNMLVDISERKQAEEDLRRTTEQREVLIQELDHRVKNSLAAVQSLANASLPDSPGLQTFFGRVRALAEAHRLLADTRWDGGCLESIVTTILKPYSERAHVTGGGVRLTPKAAQTMCMVTNELATNAVKYGALSSAGGRIHVAWSVSRESGEAVLSLSWVEIGGPAVTGPARQGFGTKLIQEAVEYELGGRTELTYAPDGLRCTIELPWSGNIRKVKTSECP